MGDQNADLKSLIRESKASLFEMEELLGKAETLLEKNSDPNLLEKEEWTECAAALSKVVEKIQDKLNRQSPESAGREVLAVHQQMAETCNRALLSFQRLEMEYERNLQEIEGLLVQFGITRDACLLNENSQNCRSPLGMLLAYAKKCFSEHRYEECAKVLHAILKIVPNEPEALTLLHDAEKRWEDQQMADELAIHVENVKKEAMDQFDRGNFKECVGKFQFLCEIEPGNPLYTDFLQLSLEELKVAEAAKPVAVESRWEEAAIPIPIPVPVPAPPAAPLPSVAPALLVEEPPPNPTEPKVEEEAVIPAETVTSAPALREEAPPVVALPAEEFQGEEGPSQCAPTALPDAQAEVQRLSPEDIDEAWAELFRLKDMVEDGSPEKAESSPALPPPAPPLASPSTEDVSPETLQTNPVEPVPLSRRYWPYLAVAAVLLIACLPAAFLVLKRKTASEFPPTPVANCQLIVNSDPPGAAVFLDGVNVGETNLSLQSLPAGKHELRVEKPEFQSLIQDLVLTPDSTPQLALSLVRVLPPETDPALLSASIQELMQQKRFGEASQRCDQLAAIDPAHPLVKESRSKIRQFYLQTAGRSLAAQKWEEARLSLENLLRIFPRDSEARNQMRSLKDKVKALQVASTAEQSLRNKIKELEGQLAHAMSSGNFLPPHSSNALELSRQLLEISPYNAAADDAQGQILRDLAGQAQGKLASKDLEGTRSLLSLIQNYFPGSSELANLRAQVRSEELKQQNQFNSWIQKAEAALAAGQYVSPSQDNAVLYCNRALSLDSQNAVPAELKQEAFRRAGQKTAGLIASGKYEEARDVCAALLAYSQHEKPFPLNPQDLKKELEKLEFQTWSVVHDHAIGSCNGKLRFNGYLIAFVPAGDSRDGFTAKLTEIVQTESGERLKIQLKNKTYRFQINNSANREENREKLTSLHRQMTSMMALLEK